MPRVRCQGYATEKCWRENMRFRFNSALRKTTGESLTLYSRSIVSHRTIRN
jgi:hypothetical protein